MGELEKKSDLKGDEIGAMAKALDQRMTTTERMKLKKNTLYRLVIALLIYAGIMALMMAFL